jgi:hypothetical protein
MIVHFGEKGARRRFLPHILFSAAILLLLLVSANSTSQTVTLALLGDLSFVKLPICYRH